MSDGSLLLRERRISKMVSQYAEGRDAAADAFALDEARTDFEEMLGWLRGAKEQAARLRARGAKIVLPPNQEVINEIGQFRELADADPGAVRDRAAVVARSRAHVSAYTAAVGHETEAYVDRARHGTGQGMAEILALAGLGDAAQTLAAALGDLQAATQTLPNSEAALDAVDQAANAISEVLASLGETSAGMLGFVTRMIAANGTLGLETLTGDELDQLVSSGAAKNFVIAAKRRM